MKIYLAGPLFTFAEIAWNAALAAELRRLYPDKEIAVPQEFCKGIIHSRDIMEACCRELMSSHTVVVNADGADVDSGTAFEAGIAHGLCKRILVYRTDFRRAGDCDSNMNLMLAYAGEILDKYQDIRTLAIRIGAALRR